MLGFRRGKERIYKMKDAQFVIDYCFLDDYSDYFNSYWERNSGMGGSAWDPDSKSITLQKYNQFLWSKQLPNGEFMDLSLGADGELLWNGSRYSSDSIIVSFRYRKYRSMIEQIMDMLPDYKSFFENYLRKAYTIGGEIILPKRRMGMNQSRGTNRFIGDRFDLTLECIRRYYLDLESPLQEVIEKDKGFFNLFVDFKGYVDFFFLQDLVSDDYSDIKFFKKFEEFGGEIFPETPDEYLDFINRELVFVGERNKRIGNFIYLYKK